MTDKKMTKEEAQEAAEEWAVEKMRDGYSARIHPLENAITVEHSGNFRKFNSKQFPYAEPVPVPALDVPVINSNGQVRYSLGKLHISGDLMAIPFPEASGPIRFMHAWEPVEIVRNGRYAKALELLDKGARNMDTCESAVWHHDARQFLADAEKAGEA